jgi:hypothetical protein
VNKTPKQTDNNSGGAELWKHETEGYYRETSNGVFFYWRVVGSDTWNVQKTALKKKPYTTLTVRGGFNNG